MQLAVGHLAPKQGSSILYLYVLTDPRKIAPLWYLHALFCISVLYSLIKVKLKLASQYNFLLGLLLYLVSAYISTRGVEIGFVSDILKYYVFFSIGDLLSRLILSERAKELFYSRKLFFILSVPFIIVQCIVMKYNIAHRDIFYVENAIPLLYLVQGIIGCSFSIAFSFLLQKWNVLSGLRTIGFHSLYIYCMHYLVIIVSGLFFIKILHLHNTLLLVAICWTVALSLPIFTYKLSNRLNLWWLFSLSKPKTARPIATELNKKSPPLVAGSLSAYK